MDALFYRNTTIYEVNLRQYTFKGDIPSFLPHVSRLKEMGVDVIWLMPVHPIGMQNRKGIMGSPYSCRDYSEVNPDLGTKEDFRSLVDLVHSCGMKIIIDWVANHTSWDHVWTYSNPDFFLRDDNGEFISPFDWTDVIQINHQNKFAQDAMIQSMLYWVKEFDIDGFRADMAHLTPIDFWLEAKSVLENSKPDLIWLAETEDLNYYQAFDVIYAWQWMHKTKALVDNRLSFDEFMEFLKSSSTLPHLYFTSNHDENSWNGTEYEKYGVYAKALVVFSFFYPYAVPLIYSGQEIPNLNRLSFFDKDELDWCNGMELFLFYKILIEERKQLASDYEFEFIDMAGKFIAFKLSSENELLLVFLCFENEPFLLQCQLLKSEEGIYKNIFTSNHIEYKENIKIEMCPGEYIILKHIKNKPENYRAY